MDPRIFTKFVLYLKLVEPLIEALLDKAQLDRVVKVAAALSEERRIQLINLLQEDVKVFT